MSQSNPVNKAAAANSLVGILVGLSFALYVYRISVGGVSLTLLRLTVFALAVSLLLDIVLKGRRVLSAYFALTGGVTILVLLNAFWYFGLDNYPVAQREIGSHFINLATLLVLVAWIRTERQLNQLLNGYLVGAIVALFIGFFAFLFGEIPFEGLLREFGLSHLEGQMYTNTGDAFTRLTGSFQDPNFFGVYLLTVIVISLWMFRFCGKSGLYLLLAAVSVVALLLTLSRTAYVGLFVFGGLSVLWMKSNYRLFVLSFGVATLIICSILLAVFSDELVERIFDASSAYERLGFIFSAVDAFVKSPFFGGGPGAIVDEATGIATAHLMYLSVLAKFGIFGAMAYFFFVFFPLLKISVSAGGFLRKYRLLIISLYVPLFFMYFFYDFLFFLEFQYFVFSIGYVVVFSTFSRARLESSNKINCDPRALADNCSVAGVR
mgnify:CR=1 FL=1